MAHSPGRFTRSTPTIPVWSAASAGATIGRRLAILALDLFSELSDHIAVRKILQGVKDRVDGSSQPFALGTIEFAIYLAAALLFLAALVLVLIRPLTWRGWLAGLAAGMIWLVVWYGPAPVWMGALLDLLVIVGLIRGFRRTAAPEIASEEPKAVENQ